MRFRLDPKAPEVERPQVPPPPAPGASARPAPGSSTLTPLAAPPPPPAPAAGAPANARKNRRLLVIAAISVVGLVALGAAAYGITTALAYPDQYLLESDETPRGMTITRLTAQERARLGIESNPGRMSQEALDDYNTRDGERPTEGWAELLGDATGGSGRVAIFALQYANEDDAKSSAQQLRAICSFASGAVLRDGDVVVAVVPDGSGMRSLVPTVAKAVQDKSGAATVCGL